MRALTPSPVVVTAIASVAAAAFGGALGAALGWLSWRFWVLGLLGLVLGLALGWTLAVLTAWLGRPPRGLVAVVMLGVVVGWVVFQVFEDHHQRLAYRVALAEARAVETGLPPAEVGAVLAAGGLDYLAAGGDAALDAQVEAAVGFDGPLGRWVFRAQGGVRLAGSWQRGRALPVGVPGVAIATLLELALGVFVAMRVVRRLGALRSAP